MNRQLLGLCSWRSPYTNAIAEINITAESFSQTSTLITGFQEVLSRTFRAFENSNTVLFFFTLDLNPFCWAWSRYTRNSVYSTPAIITGMPHNMKNIQIGHRTATMALHFE